MSGVDVEALVVGAARGDEAAWHRLWSAVEPVLSRTIAQRRFLGPLGTCEDERRSIIVAVMARLRADEFARLKTFLDARAENPTLSFLAWLRVVAKRVGIDYLRAHPDYVRRCAADRSRPGTWVRPGALPPSHVIGRRPPVTNQVTARRILDRLGPSLPAAQRRAIELWSHGVELGEIARAIGLADAGAADRCVRAALDRLRRAVRV